MTYTDECDRCGMPAVQDAAGRWVHAEAADAVFCSIVMQCLDNQEVNDD